MKSKILIIVGPTASGKSDLAVSIAQKYKGEVISADSRQVYKGLNIGSGKITKKEMQEVPHHLLDVADPKKQFSVAYYKLLAEKKIQEIIEQDKLPIIVGGTGFYIDAVTGRTTLPEVPPNPELRKKLETKSTEVLYKLLRKKDPDRARAIDPRNKVRVIRALEIVAMLGKVPTLSPASSKYTYIWIGLKPEKEVLEKRIHDRVLKRLPAMIREAKKLHADGLSWKRMGQVGIEYKYLALFSQKKISKQELIDGIVKGSKSYAKRQMTWFKRNENIRWFDPKETNGIVRFLYASMSRKGD